jgi:type I restriction enzyme S subunit
LPEGWEWCRLGEVVRFSDNLNIHSEYSPSQLINYIDIDAIDNKKQRIKEPKVLPVRELSSRARRVLKKGHVLYSLVRPYLHNLAIVEKEKEFLIGSTGFAVFTPILSSAKFLFWLLLSRYIEELYLKFMDGFNSPSITHEQFTSTLIPFPPYEEQKAIVEKVESLMEKFRELEEEISQSEQHAQMLMQAVLKEAFEN